ncbi:MULTISPECIES: hypothetical protein [unclassified Tenacibaculum]|uniref:hypothetical protein n=1 Tax=unclassified Tenacibaculum TaxID=2635139 RepID=UPI001F2322E5|nr:MULTISPECIES: hypothetical protein [unclassified Tenacibaculum]MCF2875156.1 hypothetical protein [Tenacibaculum sp. Cn5-1]MCF2935232.1 hypothetical protein [Tenacibaculum sp. Cn5-34]MCG7511326.1 hypothetical protein [Tenacibaculum sp. Cn5-46]
MKKTITLLFLIISSISFSQNSISQNGLNSTVTGQFAANALQAKRYEIAKVIYNAHHWQNSSIIEVELFNVRYSSGYEKFLIQLGYGTGTTGTSPIVTHLESYGIAHNAKITLGEPVNHSTSSGGYPNKVISIYADVRYYSIYKAKISHLRQKVSSFTAHQQIIINENPTGTDIDDFTPPALKKGKEIFETSNTSFDLRGRSNKSLMLLEINNERPTWKDQISIVSNLSTPYGIAFSGSGHHRGGLYAENLTSPGSGNITLWARNNGKVTIEGHDIILNNRNKVGIGTTSIPDDYKVAIAGNVITEEIKVQLKTNWWPDFVFNKDYNLPTLEEVEKHIKEKGHLKNIPSAKEVKENDGIELGEMNRKLLQKIEELTLYTIQQQKELQKQKEKNSTLEARLLKLEKLILK